MSFIAIEPDRCIGCGTCSSACHEGHERVGLQAEPRIQVITTEAVTAAITCHHCQDAPCLQVCPVNAIVREEDCIHVLEQQCVGCRLCAVVCPFGAIHPSGTSIAGVAGIAYDTPIHSPFLSDLLTWDPGVYTTAVKCDLCVGVEESPCCVSACPTNALRLVDQKTDADLIQAKRVLAASQESGINGMAGPYGVVSERGDS